jgi:cyanate permease
MFGRVGSGYLQDRIFGPHVASAIFAIAAIGMLMLWTGRGAASALTAAFLVGLAMGAEIDIVAFLMSRYFGLRSLGTCVAVGFGGFILAGGIGVFLMGAGFDATGSYALPLAGFSIAMVVAALLMTGLGPYRFAVMSIHESEPVQAGAA